jgi:hypothetical protein
MNKKDLRRRLMWFLKRRAIFLGKIDLYIFCLPSPRYLPIPESQFFHLPNYSFRVMPGNAAES